ncbi:MAG: DUF4369 domain-containing protein [Bacteroidales bacterium]|nr:DUF4369 domain-containing protein [Bacteroidales bacterium]
MRKNTLYNLFAAAALIMLASCSNDERTVSISGTVNEGKGEKIALMHLSGNNPVLVDTLTLGDNGVFKFKPTVEKGGPDLFCLVLGSQTIPVVIDTLQTPVVITANKEHFSTTYQVQDSLNNVLREAVGYGNDLRRKILNITNLRRDNKMGQLVYNDSLETLVSNYKANMLEKYIYKDPSSPVSYYVLFETVSGLQIFDPMDRKDNRAYGAVANLWVHTYPNSPRTAFLEQRAKEGIAARMQAKRDQERTDSLIQHAVKEEATFVDLNLIGTKDELVALSSVNGKGSITLLDFTAYYITEVSVPHNELLMKIYDKYKAKGVKIYQVCMDPDINFWKVSADNLPWTVVRDTELLFDENGMVQYSAAAALYNVTNIPTTFIMGRDGAALNRVEDDSKLEAAVTKVM